MAEDRSLSLSSIAPVTVLSIAFYVAAGIVEAKYGYLATADVESKAATFIWKLFRATIGVLIILATTTFTVFTTWYSLAGQPEPSATSA